MQLIKMLFDLGPLIVFFTIWSLAGDQNNYFDAYMPAMLHGKENGFFPATAGFMIATLISIAGSWLVFRKVETMALVTAVMVFVFGGLTLYMSDDTFLKMKPTFVYLLFAFILATGLLLNRPFLKYMFNEAFSLTPEGWRILTWRWVTFFVFLAFLNEAVWRNFSTDLWVKLKVFGFLPITMAFAIAQVGIIQKFSTEEKEE